MYTIENRQVNTNSMTVDQAQRYYSRPRTVDEFITHWWGYAKNRAKSPMDIYNYMLGANKSVNFILGWDDAQGKVRIIAMTPLSRVALTTQSANIFSISVEVDPLITTTDPRAYELKKALGWLHLKMELTYKKRLRTGLHKQYWATECSLIDKNTTLREAEKWRTGDYDSKSPQPSVEGAKVVYESLEDAPQIYRFKEAGALHNFNHKKWADMETILSFAKGDTLALVGVAHNQSVSAKGSFYGMTEHSFGKVKDPKQVPFTNGVNMANLEMVVTTKPPAVQPPKEVPLPPEVPTPEEPEMIPPSVDSFGAENNALLLELVSLVKAIFAKINNVFK